MARARRPEGIVCFSAWAQSRSKKSRPRGRCRSPSSAAAPVKVKRRLQMLVDGRQPRAWRHRRGCDQPTRTLT